MWCIQRAVSTWPLLGKNCCFFFHLSGLTSAGGIGLHVNEDKTEYTCFNQRSDISTLKGGNFETCEEVHLSWKQCLINWKWHQHVTSKGIYYREAEEVSWCPSWSNSLWQGCSWGLVHCPGGNATDPIWRVLASSNEISSWTPLKPQHSIPWWQWEPSACRSCQCCQKKGSSIVCGWFCSV